MKGGIARHVLANKIMSTPPPKHMTQRGDGKPGQTFNVERLEAICERYGVDPCEVAVKGLMPEHAPDLSDKDRKDIALKLMEYMIPKQRAVDANLNVDGSLTIEMVKDFAGQDPE